MRILILLGPDDIIGETGLPAQRNETASGDRVIR